MKLIDEIRLLSTLTQPQEDQLLNRRNQRIARVIADLPKRIKEAAVCGERKVEAYSLDLQFSQEDPASVEEQAENLFRGSPEVVIRD